MGDDRGEWNVPLPIGISALAHHFGTPPKHQIPSVSLSSHHSRFQRTVKQSTTDRKLPPSHTHTLDEHQYSHTRPFLSPPRHLPPILNVSV